MRNLLAVILLVSAMFGCNATPNAQFSQPTTTDTAPIPDTYFIGGAIERGGVYAFAGRDMTLLQAIASAGGSRGRLECFVDIIRHTGHNAEYIRNISVGEILAGKHADVALEPGDVIDVLPGPSRPT